MSDLLFPKHLNPQSPVYRVGEREGKQKSCMSAFVCHSSVGKPVISFHSSGS